MTQRWKQRPPAARPGATGATDDELRPHQPRSLPEKVLAGRARGRGRRQLLPQPAARLSWAAPRLNQLPLPAALARPRISSGNPDTFYNVHRSEIPKYGGPRVTSTLWADDDVTPRCSTRRSGTRSRTPVPSSTSTATASSEPVYYNGYRAGVDLVGPEGRRGGRRWQPPLASRITSAWSTWRSTACRAAAVLVDVAHHLGHDFAGSSTARRSKRSWRPTTSSVEARRHAADPTRVIATKVLQ